MAYIDKAVRRVLPYVKFALGLFDRPYYGDPKLVKKVVARTNTLHCIGKRGSRRKHYSVGK